MADLYHYRPSVVALRRADSNGPRAAAPASELGREFEQALRQRSDRDGQPIASAARTASPAMPDLLAAEDTEQSLFRLFDQRLQERSDTDALQDPDAAELALQDDELTDTDDTAEQRFEDRASEQGQSDPGSNAAQLAGLVERADGGRGDDSAGAVEIPSGTGSGAGLADASVDLLMAEFRRLGFMSDRRSWQFTLDENAAFVVDMDLDRDAPGEWRLRLQLPSGRGDSDDSVVADELDALRARLNELDLSVHLQVEQIS